MLRSRDVQTTPALQCIRQWMLRMEVDVSEWRPECLAPLALALRRRADLLGAHQRAARKLLRVGRRRAERKSENIYII